MWPSRSETGMAGAKAVVTIEARAPITDVVRRLAERVRAGCWSRTTGDRHPEPQLYVPYGRCTPCPAWSALTTGSGTTGGNGGWSRTVGNARPEPPGCRPWREPGRWSRTQVSRRIGLAVARIAPAVGGVRSRKASVHGKQVIKPLWTFGPWRPAWIRGVRPGGRGVRASAAASTRRRVGRVRMRVGLARRRCPGRRASLRRGGAARVR